MCDAEKSWFAVKCSPSDVNYGDSNPSIKVQGTKRSMSQNEFCNEGAVMDGLDSFNFDSKIYIFQ